MSAKGPATIDDLRKVPKDGRVYELVDGAIIVTPAGGAALEHRRQNYDGAWELRIPAGHHAIATSLLAATEQLCVVCVKGRADSVDLVPAGERR